MTVAVQWATRITTVAFEMAVPAVLGHWLDERLGTFVVFVSIGAILGLFLGIRTLLAIASPHKGKNSGGPGNLAA